jgi:hypothetical protein
MKVSITAGEEKFHYTTLVKNVEAYYRELLNAKQK